MSDANAWMSYRSGPKSSEQLSRQSLGRALSQVEQSFSDALETVFSDGIHDFAAVAAELTRLGVVAPRSGRNEWTAESLESELNSINRDLDEAYRENGIGA